MALRDIYYYFIAFAMMAGVLIAHLLNLNIDQKQDGSMSIKFGIEDFSYRLHRKY